ncbi:ABC transporter ATP-binding protein [Clostridium saccharoperbutylacetonicum]|uniref:ABC transporter ATP-binding protein n=1 Tax=Clostridium saccharoperbutylacetonicum TaxID=36745 RepID=UPI0039ECF9E5
MAQRNTYFQDEIIQKEIDIKQLGRTIKYVLPYKKVFILICVLMLIAATASMTAPLLLRYIINHTIIAKDYGELLLIIIGFVTLAGIEIGINFAHQRLMGKMGHNVIAQIRKDIFYKLQELPFDYFDSRPDGKIVVRVTDYINDLANFFTNNLLLFLVYIVKIVAVTVFMLAISVQLTAIVFGAVIPMMICVFGLRYVIRKLFAYLRARNSNRTAFLVESIMGEKIVKNNNRSAINEKVYMEIQETCAKTWMKIFMRNELNTPTVEVFWNIGTLCLFGISLYMMLHGNNSIDAGTVIAFISYMSLFSGPITQVAVIIQQLAQVSSNLEQIFDTIDYPVDIESKDNGVEVKDVRGQIDFENITFAYEDEINVLENFTLNVKPGETIALVGPTGAGKTTVINTITRFYDVKNGKVKIDGIDVKDATLASLRREVGVLMQDPFIFKGTVIDNIRYGRPDATDDECIEAAKTIFADKCINKMKDGFYQELEERGAGLSAGEKQLISFARIILKNPSVIILDEATSSIDTATENLIKKAMDVILKDKTAFIVAHRLSTIRDADRILYIANKGIAEEGTHEELMKLRGLYYSLN